MAQVFNSNTILRTAGLRSPYSARRLKQSSLADSVAVIIARAAKVLGSGTFGVFRTAFRRAHCSYLTLFREESLSQHAIWRGFLCSPK